MAQGLRVGSYARSKKYTDLKSPNWLVENVERGLKHRLSFLI